MGAEVAEDPKGYAGDEVGIGVLNGEADMVPGTVHAPFKNELESVLSPGNSLIWTPH